MTDDLVRWLRAELDYDKRVARAAGGAAWEELPVSGWVHTSPLPSSEWQPSGYDHHVASAPSVEDRAHIVAHDPARVLREIDAKRRTLERHTPHSSGTIGCSAHCSRPHPGAQVCNHDGYRWPCPDVRDLASVYDQRPGYKESWRP